jgi:phosphotransferase system enzyme I (PtsI)
MRVSVEGSVKCMLPMITTIDEIEWARAVVREIQAELTREGLPFDPEMEIGVMIEVPAAAIMADALADRVAFFSIGTNDLIQYTLAVDRTDEHAAELFSPAEPAVLRFIQMVIDAGQGHGVPVSMCGEMAGDPTFVELLLGMGLRAFSVAPARAPELKKIVRSVTLADALALASEVLSLTTREEVVSVLSARAKRFGLDEYIGTGAV